jgi:hypothetical protein
MPYLAKTLELHSRSRSTHRTPAHAQASFLAQIENTAPRARGRGYPFLRAALRLRAADARSVERKRALSKAQYALYGPPP